MFDRKRRILDLIKSAEYVSVNELRKEFQVSGATIRNDLYILESERLIERVHGGARRLEANELFASYAARLKLKADEKRKIAEEAAKLVSNRSVIGLDGSTTSFYLARCLAGRDITVITNGFYAAIELAQHRPTHVILIGGEVNWELGCISGRLAETLLGPAYLGLTKNPAGTKPPTLKVEKFFTSPGALTVEDGLMDIDMDENFVKSLMIAAAKQVIAMAYSDKIGRTTLLSYAPISAINCLITDNQADPECLKQFELAGVNVIIAR